MIKKNTSLLGINTDLPCQSALFCQSTHPPWPSPYADFVAVYTIASFSHGDVLKAVT